MSKIIAGKSSWRSLGKIICKEGFCGRKTIKRKGCAKKNNKHYNTQMVSGVQAGMGRNAKDNGKDTVDREGWELYIKEQDGIISFELLKAEVNRTKLCRCLDAAYTLDVNNRLVICEQCGAILDPFDALLKIQEKQQEWVEYQQKAAKRARLFQQEADRTLSLMQRYRNTRRIAKLCQDGLFPVCPHCRQIIAPERITEWSRPYENNSDNPEGKDMD